MESDDHRDLDTEASVCSSPFSRPTQICELCISNRESMDVLRFLGPNLVCFRELELDANRTEE